MPAPPIVPTLLLLNLIADIRWQLTSLRLLAQASVRPHTDGIAVPTLVKNFILRVTTVTTETNSVPAPPTLSNAPPTKDPATAIFFPYPPLSNPPNTPWTPTANTPNNPLVPYLHNATCYWRHRLAASDKNNGYPAPVVGPS